MRLAGSAGWWLVMLSGRADGITIPSPMRLAVIMSMGGYVAMSSCRTGWDYNTVMYAVGW